MRLTLLLITLFITLSGIIRAQSVTLPATWGKDFTIVYTHGAGMTQASTKITFSRGSCLFDKIERNGHRQQKIFHLTNAEYTQVLAKLKSLNISSVKAAKRSRVVYDKESESLCFVRAGQKERCLEDGATTTISSGNDRFISAIQYLQALASKKSGIK